MLYGPFKEAQQPASPTESWIVELPEDGPDATEILFNIIHSHFGRIPNVLSLQELVGILVVAEKYDMIQLLRPWIKDWFTPHCKDVKPNDFALMLCTTWHLGDAATFTNIATKMCVDCGINSSGQLVIQYEYPQKRPPLKRWETLALSEPLEPPGLLGESQVHYLDRFRLLSWPIPLVVLYGGLTPASAW